METDNKMAEAINEAVEDGKLEMTEWESDFMDSINDRLDTGGSLTKKQRETLDRIQEKYGFGR